MLYAVTFFILLFLLVLLFLMICCMAAGDNLEMRRKSDEEQMEYLKEWKETHKELPLVLLKHTIITKKKS